MLGFYILSEIIMMFLIMIFKCIDLMHRSPFPNNNININIRTIGLMLIKYNIKYLSEAKIGCKINFGYI